MIVDMFLKVAGLAFYKGLSQHSSVSVDECAHHQPRPANREKSDLKRTLVLTLQLAVGTAVCAGTILAIFAWAGASL